MALAALYERLRAFIGSMTTAKTPTTPLDRFSWAEAICWAGGWEHARGLLQPGGSRA